MSGTDIDNLELSPEELQARLAERDELVAELTSRLEQAAEQLDRLKRMGADRGLRIGGGTLPPELVEQQRQLAEDLQQALEVWGDIQPGLMFSRIEMQLEEIRDLVVHAGSSGAMPASSAATIARTAEADLPPTADSAGDSAGEQTGKTGESGEDAAAAGLSTYEAFKAGLAPEEGTAEQQPPPTEAAGSAVGEITAEVEAAADADKEGSATADIPRVDPPEEIEADETDPERLWQAIEQRDSYIVYLSQRLRAAETAQRPVDRWSDLENAPEELADSLRNYEKQLDDMLRTAEVEISLERARLGREAAQLEQQKQLLEREKNRLGIRSGKEASEAEDGEEDVPKARTWWALFRRNEEEKEE